MKKKIFIGLLCFSSYCHAQLFNIDHLIDTDIGFIRVQSGDFDGDGDPDLLTTSSQLVAWYENLDGLGTFGDPITIDTNMEQSFNQIVVDLDEDGHEDVIISYFDQDFIAYYRNLGGGSFAPPQTLAAGLNTVRGVEPADLDGDGDLDLILGVSNGTGLYWIQQESNGSFGSLIPISTTLSQARTQYAGDIDGDGDLDVISNSGGSMIMSWFENTNGQGDFSVQHIIEDGGFYEPWFGLADLDGDGDLDIFTEKFGVVLWRENIDGNGTFENAQTLFEDTVPPLEGFSRIYAVDLDNDGDLEITYDSGFDFGKIYHLNDGQGNFGPANFIDPVAGGTTGNNLPVDIDGDGDIDLINSSLDVVNSINDLYWYENLTILNIDNFSLEELKIYPNPAKEVLTVDSPTPITKVTFYSLLGAKLLEVTKDFDAIKTENLAGGVILIKIETEKGTVIEKFVKE